ncbi:discoidin domain-containing protein [Paenibacillus sp. SYP-B3998]|nr:discoidin domain-containing protein [Paenibacillus sp. SYP-B3998]
MTNAAPSKKTGKLFFLVFLCFAIVISMFSLVPSFQTKAFAAGNLALGKVYNASTTWSSSYSANLAFDGNSSTRWSASSGSLNNQWISIDFGTATTYDQAVIKEVTFQRVTSYKLQSSDDGSTYTDISGTTGTTLGASKTINFSPVSSRYLRLYVNSASAVPTLNEIEVYSQSTTPTPTPTTTPNPTPTPTTTPPPTSHDSKFPPGTLQFLWSKTGLDGEQWDNIMKLINKPEQDNINWTEYYGYCENINDDRGFTIGIFGATTGGTNDDGPDGPALFKEFDASSGSSNPTIAGGLSRAGVHGTMQGSILKITDSKSYFCGKINSLQNNAAWRDAMWNTFYKVYIKYSVEQASQRGFTTALTIGSFVDTALNQGAAGNSGSLEGVLSRSGNSTNEKTFMTNFYAKRTLIVDTNQYNQPPNGKNRVKEWSSLLNMGETDLKNADAAVVSVTDWEMH